jgi:hypothetical protein
MLRPEYGRITANDPGGATAMNTREVILFCKTLLISLGFSACSLLIAQEADPEEQTEIPRAFNGQPMTAVRMGELILNVDDEAVLDGTTWFFHVEELDAAIVYDVAADRMRILIPIGDVDDLDPEELVRLMQANFDSALDARYAVARGKLWGVFIHPLSTLTDEEFLVGLGQTVNVAMSYGTSYSSGLFTFGSGDSAEIERNRLIEQLKEKRT